MPLSASQHCYHRTLDRRHLPLATLGTVLSAERSQTFRAGAKHYTRPLPNLRHRQDKASSQAV